MKVGDPASQLSAAGRVASFESASGRSSTLREQIRPRLSERQVSTRLVNCDVAAIDRGSDCRHVLVNVAAGAEELLVDGANLEPSGVVRFHPLRESRATY